MEKGFLGALVLAHHAEKIVEIGLEGPDLAGLAGGLILCMTVLDMPAVQFFDRAVDSADLTTFFVGLVKAPVFAVLISAVGTLRGLQVTSSAEQLGRLTTVAVVQAIALIIAADAVFTIIFVRMGI